MPTEFTSAIYDAESASRVNTSRLAVINPDQVFFKTVPYVFTSGTDEAASDTIALCYLPAGSIPVPQLSSASCDIDPGTAFTFDVGTAADVDGWGDGVALTVLGK